MKIDEKCVEAGNIPLIESPQEKKGKNFSSRWPEAEVSGGHSPFLWKTCVKWTHPCAFIVALHLEGEAKLGCLQDSILEIISEITSEVVE